MCRHSQVKQDQEDISDKGLSVSRRQREEYKPTILLTCCKNVGFGLDNQYKQLDEQEETGSIKQRLKDQICILEYLPSLCKVALNMIKNGSGKTKFEDIAIIQIRKNKDLKQNIYNCEDLRYIDEAKLIEND